MPVIANQERINRFVREYGQDSFFCRGFWRPMGFTSTLRMPKRFLLG